MDLSIDDTFIYIPKDIWNIIILYVDTLIHTDNTKLLIEDYNYYFSELCSESYNIDDTYLDISTRYLGHLNDSFINVLYYRYITNGHATEMLFNQIGLDKIKDFNEDQIRSILINMYHDKDLYIQNNGMIYTFFNHFNKIRYKKFDHTPAYNLYNEDETSVSNFYNTIL